MTVTARIAAIRQETPTVRSFTLELEAEGFAFLPGQWVDFYAEIQGRALVAGSSLISLPSNTRTVDVAVKSAGENPVTRYLHERAAVGDEVFIDGGYGDFCYTSEMGDAVVLIAGGIGVTPLLGILRYIDDAAPDVRVTMICSATDPAEFLRRDELQETARRNPNVRCLFTVTGSGEGWTGRTGRIDAALLREAQVDTDALFYVCGPPDMTQGMLGLLAAEGVASTRIRFESW